ncbi:ESX secretion-associated protein EspG [Allokutzneria albata]|uniref:EspG family protein n=1 Tax=Allokutzneria albata TaxID=211114 RepID=A0A1H0BAA4_ALLAB|nr:ESX secretion-associated protein EspG [Allokutzneria albata]SDN42590.1 EspG family protein [Allokutzneria albata]
MTLFGEAPAREVVLSALEFDVLWSHLGLPDMPLVIKVPSPGKTYQERAELERAAWDGIGERGLGRPIRLDAELERMLEVLALPDREVDGRIWLGHSVRVLCAARGSDGVLAVLEGSQLKLRQTTDFGLPRIALSVLPALPAGTGRSITLPSSDLDAAAAQAGNSVEALEAALRQYGVRAEDAHALSTVVSEVGDRGQFGVAARDEHGRRRRADRVIAFFDTPAGRYLQTRSASPSGVPWSTISPADNRRLTQHLDELLAELTDPDL